MSPRDPKERTQRGIRQQTDLLAAPAPEPQTLVEAAWRDFVFAEVWTRPGLDRRARYLIGISSATNADMPRAILDGLVRGALTLKELSLAELREAALHLACYGSWPRGMALDAAITRVADALGLPPAPFTPIPSAPRDPLTRQNEIRASFEEVMTFFGPSPSAAFIDVGVNDFAFGEIWRRPGLDRRARRWISLVGAADSASSNPIRTHIFAAMKSGDVTLEEMNEFVLQYAVHCGWPRASNLQTVVLDMAERIKKGLSFN